MSRNLYRVTAVLVEEVAANSADEAEAKFCGAFPDLDFDKITISDETPNEPTEPEDL